jgi:hypothetical protein
MNANEINLLAVALSQAIRKNLCEKEIDQLTTLLGQLLCNLSTYNKCK